MSRLSLGLLLSFFFIAGLVVAEDRYRTNKTQPQDDPYWSKIKTKYSAEDFESKPIVSKPVEAKQVSTAGAPCGTQKIQPSVSLSEILTQAVKDTKNVIGDAVDNFATEKKAETNLAPVAKMNFDDEAHLDRYQRDANVQRYLTEQARAESQLRRMRIQAREWYGVSLSRPNGSRMMMGGTYAPSWYENSYYLGAPGNRTPHGLQFYAR